MKVKPFREELILLALDFLEKELGEQAIAQNLRSKHISDIPQWVVKDNMMLKKGLLKIVKAYVQMDKKLKNYFSSRQPEAEQEGSQVSQEVQPQPRPKKNRKKSVNSVVSAKEQSQSKKTKTKQTKVNGLQVSKTEEHHENTSKWVITKFQAPKKLEQIDKEEHQDVVYHSRKAKMIAPQMQEEEESEQIPVKKEKTKKKKMPIKKETSESEDESSEQEQKKPVKMSKRELKKQKQIEKQIEQIQEQEEAPPKVSAHTRSHDYTPKQANGDKKYGKSFSRINKDEVGPIPENLKDNTFEAKFKFGKGGDEWGKFGYEKLKDTRGDSFKKTKGKLKNRAFQGANVDFNVINSIPL